MKTPRNGRFPEWKIPRNIKTENIGFEYVFINVISLNGVDNKKTVDRVMSSIGSL